MSAREQWATRWGFILAALGSAVGLGNIWRFPYLAGENGGAAFLIIYILCVVLIGAPVMMAEFMTGRRSQSDAVQSITKIAPGKPWFLAGGIGVAAAFFILTFYGVIAGWGLKYLFSYLTGGLWRPPADGYAGFFGTFVSKPFEPIIWQAIFMAIVIGIIYLGVKKGIELSSKIMMPVLGILVLILAIYSISLEGSSEGLAFLFSPDWSAFTEPGVYLAAMGQAFFSLSLGMGVMITYSGYLSQQERLPSATGSIITFDTLFAVLAGVVIFPALFAFGGDPTEGPGLVFITLPEIFGSMGGFGAVIGFLFFFLFSVAALSSAISLLEVSVAYFMRRFSMNRQTTALMIGIIIFMIGIPSSLSQGAVEGLNLLPDTDFLSSIDFITGSIMLPLSGFIIALFVGWGWRKTELFEQSDFGQTGLGMALLWLLRVVVPIAVFLVFLQSVL